MEQIEFHGFVVGAVRRALGSAELGTVGHLVLTQARSLTDSVVPKIREPELRHGLAQEAEARRLYYGIEVPTKNTYRFTDAPGTDEIAARHDFALPGAARHDAKRDVLIELKEGQVSFPRIAKDFQKLFRERAGAGKAVIHVLQATNAGSLPALLATYSLAIDDATRRVGIGALAGDESWFTLFVVEAEGRIAWHWSASTMSGVVAKRPDASSMQRIVL